MVCVFVVARQRQGEEALPSHIALQSCPLSVSPPSWRARRRVEKENVNVEAHGGVIMLQRSRAIDEFVP